MIKDDKCPLCKNKVETITHLMIECKIVTPLNRIILKMLNSFSERKFNLSETMFRFCSIPYIEKYQYQLTLILLTYSRHIIWMSRNEAKHESKDIRDFILVSKFLNRIKCRITVDHSRLNQIEFIELWCINSI